MSKNLTNKLPEGITARELDLSPEESKKRMQKVLYKQKEIRRSIIYYSEDLHKISFPSYPIGH